MASREQTAPSRHAALEEARTALLADRDELRAAQDLLRRAARAHDVAVRDARRRVEEARRGGEGGGAGADVEAAEGALGEALSAQRGVEDARPLLHRLDGLLDDGESVLEMAPGVSAGHDGIVVATERRVLFLALRRTVVFEYADVTGVAAKGRWFGGRLLVSAAGGRLVVSGLAAERAGELAGVVRERLGVGERAGG